jgi:hypothetical protein
MGAKTSHKLLGANPVEHVHLNDAELDHDPEKYVLPVDPYSGVILNSVAAGQLPQSRLRPGRDFGERGGLILTDA